MKLKELSEVIAERCELRAKAVLSVQEETFRQIKAAVDKGERVQVPQFGVFLGKDASDGEGKTIRLKPAAARQEDGEEKSRTAKLDGASERKAGRSRARNARKNGTDAAANAPAVEAEPAKSSEAGMGVD